MPSSEPASIDDTEEREWLLAAQKGDQEAFAHIVMKYHRLIVHVAYRLSGDLSLADDVAQDTFLKAWQKLPSFKPEGSTSLRAWLCRIAHNRTVDLMRRSRPDAELDPTLASAVDNPLQSVLRAELAAEVQAAIRRLPEVSRTALVLREYGGLSYAEIAAALDIPLGTVMSRLYNARKRLAQDLRHHLPEGTAP
ncbi:MAG: sigma-70 family RNA polymerase sigma factor [Caldilineae bacterium]|nr:MAG: sigma-70 family RNA polymerase sigma factor [Caldilineae bacterium]